MGQDTRMKLKYACWLHVILPNSEAHEISSSVES